MKIIHHFLLIVLLAGFVSAQTEAIEKTRKIVAEIVAKSYPELQNESIEIKKLVSESDYFQSRFSFGRYLTFRRMKFIIFVNPKVYELNAPENAVRSIVAHEIGHILYYSRKNRLQLLGLVNLSTKRFTQNFERRTDLEAIKRGYGEGLIAYRIWLYEHIPTKNIDVKKRNYFTPEEIQAIMKRPEMIASWQKHVPKTLSEINK
jgi:hypothetical protein